MNVAAVGRAVSLHFCLHLSSLNGEMLDCQPLGLLPVTMTRLPMPGRSRQLSSCPALVAAHPAMDLALPHSKFCSDAAPRRPLSIHSLLGLYSAVYPRAHISCFCPLDSSRIPAASYTLVHIYHRLVYLTVSPSQSRLVHARKPNSFTVSYTRCRTYLLRTRLLTLSPDSYATRGAVHRL